MPPGEPWIPFSGFSSPFERSGMGDQKPHEPTRKKLKDARKQGNILRSPLLQASMSLSIFTIIALFLIRFSWLRFQMLLQYLLVWGFCNPALSLRVSVILIPELLLPVLAAAGVAGLAVEIWQTGAGWYPTFGTGFGVVQGTRKVVKGLCSVHLVALKAVSVTALCFCFMWPSFRAAMFVPYGVVFPLQENPLHAAVRICLPICAGLLFLGGVEYLLKRRRYMRDLSMTHDELRQELREEEGDPFVKAARNMLHSSLAYEEMAARVRASKVLIVERA